MEDLDLDQIAMQLSELSQPSVLPKVGGRRQVQAFDTAEVDFSTSGWLHRVLDVVPWLNLDASFDPQDLPKAVALRLFDELSPGKSEASFQVDDKARRAYGCRGADA